MDSYFTVVIGGGAAGICAAISQKRRGASVILCEKMPQLGKKLLATGDGRCNLLNDDFTEDHYNQAARGLVSSVLKQFGKAEILDFFKGLGLVTYSREGRIFPITNQAASVLKVLEIELRRLSVPVELGFDCSAVTVARNRITVSSRSGTRLECRKVVITGGGKTYPAFGSDGSLYRIASELGHSIVEPVPVVVPLVVKDKLCLALQGQRMFAGARSVIDDKKGPEVRGELLFTRYGLSGTCILDVSESISVALNRLHKTEVFVSVDLVPFMDREHLKSELSSRRIRKFPADEMLVGLLPNKACIALQGLFESNNIDFAVRSLKDRRFKVSGSRGWNEAEFTNGGINTDEIYPATLESRLNKGVYFAGEMLDVNGQRGGYNLGWAWASGVVAGRSGQDKY